MSSNRVRIIGGAWRGRKIEFGDAPGLRPTPDRVRETLFNWLQQDIAGARCLDLFAGSGALGIEALSRGAGFVQFVERSPEVARCVEEQLERLGAAERANVAVRDAESWLRDLEARDASASAPTADATLPSLPVRFDLVFLDPPFGQNLLTHVMSLLTPAVLTDRALVYLECERAHGAPGLPAGWELLKSKSAGEVGYHLARVSARPPT